MIAVPYVYTIHAPHRAVTVRMHGRIVMADLVALRREVAADPAFDPTFSSLIDIRDCDLSGLSAADVGTLAQQSILAPSTRRAIVTNDDATFGVARMFAIRTELASTAEPVQVFRSLPPALAWLGVADLDVDAE